MCRSSSPRFGTPVFRRCSRDEFEQRLRLPRVFRQEGMGFGVLISAHGEARLTRDGREEEIHMPRSSRLWRGVNRLSRTVRNDAG